MTTRANGCIARAFPPRAASAGASSPSRPASSASPSSRRRSTTRATACARRRRSPTSRTRSAATPTRRGRQARSDVGRLDSHSMTKAPLSILADWATIVPAASALLLAAAFVLPSSTLLLAVCVVALMATVVAAVHHAEVVAHRIGEPFGTLVLALAVTLIEPALILSMMLAGGDKAAALARDSVYAAVMIIATGVVGSCLLAGALKHREQAF